MEFVYEEERRECKKISVGEVDSEKYIREVMVGWYYSFIIHEKKNLYVNEKKKKCEKKKVQMKKKRMRMRMKGENEMKRKEGRNGVM